MVKKQHSPPGFVRRDKVTPVMRSVNKIKPKVAKSRRTKLEVAESEKNLCGFHFRPLSPIDTGGLPLVGKGSSAFGFRFLPMPEPPMPGDIQDNKEAHFTSALLHLEGHLLRDKYSESGEIIKSDTPFPSAADLSETHTEQECAQLQNDAVDSVLTFLRSTPLITERQEDLAKKMASRLETTPDPDSPLRTECRRRFARAIMNRLDVICVV